MKILAVIPARYASTRFPGKPLALIQGKPMIQWVYEGVHNTGLFQACIVATDDQRIADAVSGFGGRYCLTSPNHPSGTDRCAEVASLQNENYDYIVNIQGDEPLVNENQLASLVKALDGQTEIASQYIHLNKKEDILNPSRVKVVLNAEHEALYFSRSPIPFLRQLQEDQWADSGEFRGHVGLYAYRSDILQELSKLKPGTLEQLESLEQLRWLEKGYKIKMVFTDHQSVGVDTPEDLETVSELMNRTT
ncbi:MAG: 3-deoxy-manno-octulosonate cytidylyltransferase [Bacteroidetes bacterium]|nr:MAG: 3-deoxy-manno-octulosonate cytidylyltransferase [Bacteroidota bacterium]